VRRAARQQRQDLVAHRGSATRRSGAAPQRARTLRRRRSGRPRGRSRSPRRRRATTRGRATAPRSRPRSQPDGRRIGGEVGARRRARQSSSRARDPWLPPRVDVSSRDQTWTLCAVSRRPSHRSPIRKWLGEPPAIGPNRRVFCSVPVGAEKRRFAGKERRTTPNQVLFAMQKVVGSSPISRLKSPANRDFSRIASRLRTTQKVQGSIAVCQSR
jgi:hypothetical protein